MKEFRRASGSKSVHPQPSVRRSWTAPEQSLHPLEARVAELEARCAASERARRALLEAVETLEDGFVAIDRDWRFTYVSPRAAAHTGLNGTDLIGHRLWEFFPALHGTAYETAYNRAMLERVPVSIEVEGLYDRNWYRVSVFPTQHGVSIVWSNITQHRQSETSVRESEQFTRSIIESSRDCIKTLDLEGNLLSMSEGGRRLLEIDDLQRYLHRPWSDFWQPEDRPRVNEAIAAASRGETGRFQALCPTAQGRPVWWDVMITPIRGADHRVHQLLALSRDITPQKEMEERLRETDRRKTEFLGVLSHELRNPLAPIRNSVYVIERAAPGGEQAKRALTVIDRQVTHMARLIDDLMDVTRISRGKIRLQRERVELNAIVRGTGEDVRELFRRGGITFDVVVPEQPLWAYVDRTRIEQVIGNLLHNAAKFTPRGGQARLSLAASGDGKAVIEVRDTGAGMAPDLMATLFEPFVQADQTLDRSRGGLGLGLALVKGLIELHGGSVSAFSPGSGHGAVFTLRLLLEPPPALTAG